MIYDAILHQRKVTMFLSSGNDKIFILENLELQKVEGSSLYPLYNIFFLSHVRLIKNFRYHLFIELIYNF